MLNYIRAETYKLLHRKYTYIALGIMMVLEALFAAGFAFHNSHSFATPFGGAIECIVELGGIGFCTCLLTGDIVFAGQYKNSTLKNEVSFGLSRTRIYLGKLLAQTLLSIAYMVIMLGFFLALCAICLPHNIGKGFPSDTDALIVVGYFLAAAFPLWIGGQAATCACMFLIRSDVGAATAAAVLTMMLNAVVEVVGLFISGPVGDALIKASWHMPSYMIGFVKEVIGDWEFLGRAWIVGLFWVAVSTAVGLYGFSKKEIK